jgi:hypothetical protein
MSVEKILIVFLDGVGLGEDDAGANPFAGHPLPFLSRCLDGRKPLRRNGGYSNGQAALLGLDAGLGVAGLPQSGTGQTAILTGLNAPAILGEHDGPYPNQRLRALLAEQNIFKRLLEAGKPVAYASAYPDRFLNRLKRGKGRLSANTRAALDAGLKIRGPEELQAGRAISGMLTNRYWREWGYDVPLLSPQEVGTRFVALAQDHALTFFEFWYTDVVGHRQDIGQAHHLLDLLDGFFEGIVEAANLETTLLLIISDHGNFEDLTTKQHTANPALALLIGQAHLAAAQRLSSTIDFAPLIVDLLT